MKNEFQFSKVNGFGISYALLPGGGFIRLLAVIQPDPNEKGLAAQIQSVCGRLDRLFSKEDLKNAVVQQTFFLRNLADKTVIQEAMRKYYGSDLPVNVYVPQKPCEGSLEFLVEVCAVRPEGDQKFSIDRISEDIVRLNYADTQFVFVGDIVPDNDDTDLAYKRSWRGFEMMKDKLGKAGFQMENILRTWLYQGHITLDEGDSQRYKELNHARTDFFEGIKFMDSLLPDYPFGTVCPASTGIGTDNMDIVMGCFGIKTDRKDVVAVPLENPVQTPAFAYGAVYSPKSPKFSRALALVYGETCSVYISGTASITESETVFIGDPEGQANQTLDNIAELFTESNLKRYGIQGFGGDLSDMVVARVYIKRPEYYEKIRAICEKRLGASAVIYTFGDVCRDDLLVEIEGVAFCKKR
ncbi:MAG: endoribonuclease L-PSP [Planctomycetia bacterium]|nr:endoribonuclease L-PSP [Planctomycetia bacterium]